MHKKGITISSAVGATALFGLILTSGGVFATQTCETDATTGLLVCTDSTTGAKTYQRSASATASVTVSSSCTFAVERADGQSGETSYTDVLANNSSVEVLGSRFTTSCNDPGGYAIYAVGYSNNTLGNTNLIFNNIADSTNNITTASNPANTASYWQMKLMVDTDNTTAYHPASIVSPFNNYAAIPGSYTKVAEYSTITSDENNTSLEDQAVDVKYIAHASATQPAGTYTGAVKYTMVHPSNMATPIIMIDDLEYMQDFATLTTAQKTSVLNSMTTGVQYQLKDNRGDQKEYYISKLADGNVWMTQNLDLDLTAGTTFTHSDTDLGWTTSDTGATWTVGAGYSTIPWDPVAGEFTGWDNQNALPYSADPGEKYYYTSNTESTDATFNSMAQCLEAEHTQADCQHYHAGNYYNWTAAVAGNVTNSDNAPDSICPAGWRLPRTSADEFANLLVAHNVIPDVSSTSYKADGFNTIRKYPLYLVRSGFVNSGSLNYAASNGYYWSSTVYNAIVARSLYFSSSNVNPASNYVRSSGRSVRCMAR